MIWLASGNFCQWLNSNPPSPVFFFQAEDGIRDRSPSRGLGDVYKRQDFGFEFKCNLQWWVVLSFDEWFSLLVAILASDWIRIAPPLFSFLLQMLCFKFSVLLVLEIWDVLWVHIVLEMRVNSWPGLSSWETKPLIVPLSSVLDAQFFLIGLCRC